MSGLPALRACPFCRSEDFIERKGKSLEFGKDTPAFYFSIRCRFCMCRGPKMIAIDEFVAKSLAYLAWNKRHDCPEKEDPGNSVLMEKVWQTIPAEMRAIYERGEGQ